VQQTARKIRPTFWPWFVPPYAALCWIVVDLQSHQFDLCEQTPISALRHVLFPLGDTPKAVVREIAKAHNIKTANKRESMVLVLTLVHHSAAHASLLCVGRGCVSLASAISLPSSRSI
jgi:hypothetical protein